MATLEVHDGQGGVQRVVITRDHPAMFGSNPKCEVPLSGVGVLPFHGRIRWQPAKKKFKVDASPDAQYVIVNGTRMSSSGFRLGDEIEVGGNRIFLISDADGFVSEAPARDDVTRVMPMPHASAPPRPSPPLTPLSSPDRPAPLRRLKSMSQAPQGFAAESFETGLEAVVAELGSRAQPPPAASPVAAPKSPANTPPSRGWARLFFLFSPRATTPGSEQVFSSPLAVGLAGAFLSLLLVGGVLYGVIVATSATRLYNKALQNLEDGDYRNAISRFDEFLKANPDDKRAGQARVHRAMANVRQYTTGAGASWSLALEAEIAMLDSVSEEPTYRDAAPELAEQVIKTGENLADRARASADPRVLVEAESTVRLHARVAGQSAETFYRRSRLPTKLETARAAVRKAAVRVKAIAAMDGALKGGSSAGVYASRDTLVEQYSDLAEDRDVLARMNGANDLIRKAVTFDPSRRPAETEPRAEPFGPPTTLVLRGSESGAPAPAAARGPVVYALADGFAFAVEGSTGAPLWQTAVGLTSPFPPQPITGGEGVLVVDARHDELLKLDGRTGSLVWRQSLGEPVASPPLVLGNQVIVTAPSGKLLLIELQSGELQGSLSLGMPLSSSPVTDESGRVLYVAARKACLFVLTRDPVGCAAVVYVGHAPGSVICPPARIGRYLVLPENHEVDAGRWRVYMLDEEGTKLTPVQQVPVTGWTWATPATAGSVIWATGDRGGVAAQAVGAYGEKLPFRLITRLNPDAAPSGPAFALARSEREIWVASGRSARYELDPETAKIQTSWTLAEAGPAAAPPQAAGPLAVLSQIDPSGPGVGLWGVEPQTGAVRWRTVFGSPWPSAPTLSADGSSLVALGVDGAPLTLDLAELRKGGFVSSTLPRPGAFRMPTAGAGRVEGDGWTAVIPAAGTSRLLARAGATGAFREVPMPAPLGARPVALGKELLYPGADGRVYLVDPLSGETRAEPYVPPFDRLKPNHWRAAAPIARDAVIVADDAGLVRRIARVSDPRPRLVAEVEVPLGKPLDADPATTASSVVVVTADRRVRSLAARDLSPTGAWPLESPLSQSPAAVGGHVFVTDSAGGVLAVGPDGQRRWFVKLPGGVGVQGTPAVTGDAVWLLTRDGVLHARSLADGTERSRQPLGVLPSGGPIEARGDLVLPVSLSSLVVFNPANAPTAPPEPKPGQAGPAPRNTNQGVPAR